MSDLSKHLRALAQMERGPSPYNDSLMTVVDPRVTPDGMIQFTVQDLLLEVAGRLEDPELAHRGINEHRGTAYKGVLLQRGHVYRFMHDTYSRRRQYLLETVAMFIGVSDDRREFQLSGRPEFGDSTMSLVYIATIEEVPKSTKPVANRKTGEPVPEWMR